MFHNEFHASGLSLQLCPLSLEQARIASSSTPATAMNHRTFMLSATRTRRKFWLDPVRLQNSGGFSRTEINRIQDPVEDNLEALLESWNEFFNG